MQLVVRTAAVAPAAAAPKRAAILIYPGVQIIDYTGPWEAFGRVGNVYGVSVGGAPITTSMGMQVVPNHALGEEPPADVLVVPGGGNSGEPGSTPRGVGAQLENAAVIDWIRARAEHATAVLSPACGQRSRNTGNTR